MKARDYDKIKDKYIDNGVTDKQGNLVVCFDDFGFPDFTPFAEIIVPIDMNGDYDDFTQAVAIGQSMAPSGVTLKTTNTIIDEITYTWHHHQDGRHMMLVPSDINNPNRGGPNHVGGRALVLKGYKYGDGINPWPDANSPNISKCY